MDLNHSESVIKDHGIFRSLPNTGRLPVSEVEEKLKYRLWINSKTNPTRKRLLRAVVSRRDNSLSYHLDVRFATNDSGFHLDPSDQPRSGNLLNDLALVINSVFHGQTLD